GRPVPALRPVAVGPPPDRAGEIAGRTRRRVARGRAPTQRARSGRRGLGGTAGRVPTGAPAGAPPPPARVLVRGDRRADRAAPRERPPGPPPPCPPGRVRWPGPFHPPARRCRLTSRAPSPRPPRSTPSRTGSPPTCAAG